MLPQPMWETFGHVHAASAEVGRTTAALLAGDDRGHVPEQLEEADDAMRELIRVRCKVLLIHQFFCGSQTACISVQPTRLCRLSKRSQVA